MTSSDTTPGDKASARTDATAVRQRLAAEGGARAAAGAAEVAWSVLGDLGDRPADTVAAGYWPIRTELDCRPLMERLHAAGWACALPCVVDRAGPLAFRAWRPGDRLHMGAYGIPAPGPDAPPRHPRIVIVPLLAFDAGGHRLGYGGGYYDRTLADLRGRGDVLAVGFAFAGQQVAHLPRDGDDQRLDLIVTEAGVIRPSDETVR